MTGTPPTYEQLLTVRSAWASAHTWHRALARGADAVIVQGALDELAARHGGTVPGPLDALAASAELVRALNGGRWIAVHDAREQGATWQQIADAMGVTAEHAQQIYTEAIDAQERLAAGLDTGPLRAGITADAAAARAVAGDDGDPGEG